MYPAAWDFVVSVGAVGSDGALASFSTRNAQVDLCAPGEGVLTTANPSYAPGLYGTDSGTSFAALQAAAAVGREPASPALGGSFLEAYRESRAG